MGSCTADEGSGLRWKICTRCCILADNLLYVASILGWVNGCTGSCLPRPTWYFHRNFSPTGFPAGDFLSGMPAQGRRTGPAKDPIIKEVIFMARQKSTAIYKTPFSAAYWRDAVAELKDTRMIVIAALMIALRVALKSLGIPLAPNLKINIAFFINALGAMIFGPAVAAVAAAISDTLGCILFPQGVYFFPFIFIEIAGSVIFALFLYRAKVTVTRIALSRFCIDFFVNIVMNMPLMSLYYKMVLNQSYTWMQLPTIAKNLCMFPLEAILLIAFMSVMIPIVYRMKLVYDPGTNLKLTKKVVAFLVALFILAVTATGGYLIYNYNTENQASWLSAEDKTELNGALTDAARENGLITEDQVIVIRRVFKTLGEEKVDLVFDVYDMGEGADLETILTYRSTDAKADASLTSVVEGYAVTRSDDLSAVGDLELAE